MANRIEGNTIIIDSAMGNAFVLTSASSIINITDLKIGTVLFWSSDTTGVLRLSGTNTTNCIMHLTNPNNNATPVGAHLGGSYFKDMKVPTLTAGTAFLYFF